MKKTPSSSETKSNGIKSVFQNRLALFIVLLTGLSGSIYVMSTINQPYSDQKTESIVIGDDHQKHSSKILKVSGVKRAGEQLDFYINNFNPSTSYSLEIDNKECFYFNEVPFKYKFDEEGIYKLKLKIEYQKNVFLLEKQDIIISPSANQEVKP